MMKRTYKAKKNNGISETKDVLFTAHDKTSGFEAFYIKNIKQSKREVCVGSTNNGRLRIGKVKKRKPVKKVNDLELSFTGTLTQSTYLTPDKSIHINRPVDAFDLLLNSSISPKGDRNKNPFDNLQPRKYKSPIITQQKTSKLSKRVLRQINCSSDTDDDDKENKSKENNDNKDLTNLLDYDLLVEQEKISKDNDSIDNIIKKDLLLNAFTPTNARDRRKSPNCRQVPKFVSTGVDPSSPLTSTPFLDKYRGKSIYKFSPIVMTYFDDEDIISSNNKKLTQCDNKSQNKLKNETIKYINNSSKDIEQICNNESVKKMCPKILEWEQENIDTSINVIESSSDSDHFLGFTATSQNEIILLNSNSHKSLNENKSPIIKTPYSKAFLGFSCKKNDHVTVLNDSHIFINVKGEQHDNVNNDNSAQSKVEVSKPNEEETIPLLDVSLQVQEISNDSFYDAHCSTMSDNNLLSNIQFQQPVIQLERLNDSNFKKYYDRMPNYGSDSNGESELAITENNFSNEEFEEVTKTDNDSFKNETINIDLHNTDNNPEMTECNDINRSNRISEPKQTGYGSDEEDCYNRSISFVTTRRRNDVVNESFFFLNSSSSSSCSQNEINVIHNANSSNLNENNKNIDMIDNKTNNANDNDIICHSSIKVDNSENLCKTMDSTSTFDKYLPKCEKNTMSHISTHKPSIVLQPGKKWERSLSIYRRMTIYNDTLDASFSNDEPLEAKGRKYRQSIINTMELQHHRGSVYNDSHIHCRNTIVPKLYKPTVTIIKEPNSSRFSFCSTNYDDLSGFLSEECDDTILELSKLSIAEAEHEITILEKQDSSERLDTARDYVLRRCNQTNVILFDECYPDTDLKNCRKIGEGVYGEVFLWRAGDGRARVLKVVPVAGATRVNGEQQKDFHEIISEIVIAMELSALRAPIAEIERHIDEGKDINTLDLHSIQNATNAYNEVLAVKCVYGGYPSKLLDLWDLYDECKGSENDNPAILPIDQQYIVLELANAGQDLESYQFNNAEQAYALFIQVAFGLAVGEEAFQFEHRDLHWGNVLITPSDQEFGTYILRGRPHRVPLCGVRATIIDYSLSRLSLPLGAASDHAALYNDLAADEGLFDAVGDYQFEVYRLMRDKLGNEWKNFEPYTNILWLHYTVDKMITALRYQRTNTKIHKQYITKLKGLKNRILSYGSAVQFVLIDNEF